MAALIFLILFFGQISWHQANCDNQMSAGSDVKSKLYCGACKLVVEVIQKVKTFSISQFNSSIVSICSIFESKQKCQGIFNLFSDRFILFLQNTQLNPSEICEIFAGPNCESESKICNSKFLNWRLNLEEINLKVESIDRIKKYSEENLPRTQKSTRIL
jgi:hypothetical protein